MENRKGRRFPVKWPAYVGHRTCGVAHCSTIDVSVSGLAILSPLRFPQKDRVNVEIEFAKGRIIKFIRRVMREKPTSNGKFSYGIQYLQFEEQDRLMLGEVLLAMRRAELAEAQK